MKKTWQLAFTALIAPAVVLSAGPAAADDAQLPNCTAGDLANVMGGVAVGTSAYLYTHPEANEFFTGLEGKSRDEIRSAVTDYIGAHPDVGDALRAIRQPGIDFRTRCGMEAP